MTPDLVTQDFDYSLPEQLIAQVPTAIRDDSRLLVLDRKSGCVEHRRFRDIGELTRPGDLVMVNSSRVIPARLRATRENGREAQVLLIHEEADGGWLAMVHPGGKLKVGRKLFFGSYGTAWITSVLGGGVRRIRFDEGVDVRDVMKRQGAVPLPPYIRRQPTQADRERYQTIFASEDGSVAAPTAGLHFTPDLVASLENAGVEFADLVLHIGPGTFKPVTVPHPEDHELHAEWYCVPRSAAEAANRSRDGGRIWAVGTSVARVLETSRTDEGVAAGSGWTDIFIYPPYEFKSVDVLVTNFHLPRSTLLMLVAAFGGLEPVMAAYRTAVQQEYRFYSYGDAMVII